MGALSKLSAVNRMLRGSGESPVNTLEDDGVNDVTLAVAILDETTMMYQMDRQTFNTDDTTLSPDTNGYVYIVDNTLFIDTRGDHVDTDVAVKGSPAKLYNLTDKTFVWSDDVQVRQTVLVEFADIPTPDQFAITDMAARVYQMQTLGDSGADAILSQIAMRSQMRARANEMRQADYSMLRGSKISQYISNSKYRNWLTDGRSG